MKKIIVIYKDWNQHHFYVQKFTSRILLKKGTYECLEVHVYNSITKE